MMYQSVKDMRRNGVDRSNVNKGRFAGRAFNRESRTCDTRSGEISRHARLHLVRGRIRKKVMGFTIRINCVCLNKPLQAIFSGKL